MDRRVAPGDSPLRAGADAESELAGLSGTHIELADYLVDEVVACQPPAILRFLLATSILDRFCARACANACSAAPAGRDGPPCDVSGLRSVAGRTTTSL